MFTAVEAGKIQSPGWALVAGICILSATCLANAQLAMPVNLDAAGRAMAAGVAAANNGRLDEARRDFEHAVTLAPKVSAAHAALGSVELAQNDLNSALLELNIAHTLDPADTSVDLNLARARAAAGHFEAAVSLFRQVMETSPSLLLSADESIAYATALATTGDTQTAEAALRSAIAREPDSPLVNDALGTLLAQNGRMDDALLLFQHAINYDPSLAIAHYHLGVTLLSLDRPQQALEHLRNAAAASPGRFDFELQLGRALSDLHLDAEALTHLHHAAALRSVSNQSASLYALALALQASGDSKSALPFFDAAVGNITTSDSSALINDALAHVQTGDATRALPLYARALSLGPDTATLREDFGVAYLQQSDISHAIEQFRAGLVLEPDNAHLHYDLGLALKLKDDLNAAIPEFELSERLDATLPDPAYTLGVIYMQQARFPEASAQLKMATALQPGNGDAWALLGNVLKESGDNIGALEALKRAITLRPDQPSLYIQLAAIESQAGDKEAATNDRKIAADLSRAATSRQRASFALKSGRALLDQNKLEEAILQLNTATQADPSLPEPHMLLADAYTRQGKPADAALERKRADALVNGQGTVSRP